MKIIYQYIRWQSLIYDGFSVFRVGGIVYTILYDIYQNVVTNNNKNTVYIPLYKLNNIFSSIYAYIPLYIWGYINGRNNIKENDKCYNRQGTA